MRDLREGFAHEFRFAITPRMKRNRARPGLGVGGGRRDRRFIGKVFENYGTVVAFEQREGRAQDAALEVRLVGCTERASQLEGHPQETRQLHVLGVLAHQADPGGRDALVFEEVAARADVLQIGTRNMQNYALLKEVGRVHRPVMLKRGMSATVNDLLMSAEYVLSGGNKRSAVWKKAKKKK